MTSSKNVPQISTLFHSEPVAYEIKVVFQNNFSTVDMLFVSVT